MGRVHSAFGRLAQLAEHFVYTEGVGGSIPSPPTTLPSMTGFLLGLGALPLREEKGWTAGGLRTQGQRNGIPISGASGAGCFAAVTLPSV